MANILYLVHRLPWPPDKGDKVRSHHLLRHLARRHRVHLGSFIDDPADRAHLAAVRAVCADSCVRELSPRTARLRSLRGLLEGGPLSMPYYRDAELARWVHGLARRVHLDACIVFSSSMAPYTRGLGVPTLVDFVDVDSAKWREYAPRHRWPMSWLYAREGRTLLAAERRIAAEAGHSFFATEQEAELFRGLAPESAGRVSAWINGVDADHFAPDPARASPFAAGEVPLVFTGAMDYWPNIDAVRWFAAEMLPRLRQRHPQLRLHVVGRSPTAEVRGLAGEAVSVTGTVPDVRPYLQHAAVVVAPLRLARGIQNKVLEAMAMGKAVVASETCARPIEAELGRELLSAEQPEEYVRAIELLLRDPARTAAIGAAARVRVVQHQAWDARLAALDRRLQAVLAGAPTIQSPALGAPA